MFILGLCLLLSAPEESPAQSPYQKLRYEENWRPSEGRPAEADFFTPIKFVPLNHQTTSYLSLGGEIRQRYEYTRNPTWGDDPQDAHGVYLQRYILQADLHFTRNLRVFTQVLSALESGRSGGPSPVDENQLALQNAFLDIGFSLPDEDQVLFRPGRQELLLGSGRLVDVREGPNVRRTFDGGRGIFRSKTFEMSALAFRPVEDDRGVFDDQTDENRLLWGLYLVKSPEETTSGLDFYYLGFKEDEADYAQGIADETRHSLGVRVFGDRAGWDYNWEAIYQWGEFGKGDIRAWTLATITGYSWNELRFKPRFGLSANIASGDRDADDPDLESFNALFPRGNYFSEMAVLGPRNFYNLHPSLSLELPAGVGLSADINFFWRQSKRDGVYAPNGGLLRPPGGSDKRYVATTGSFTLEKSWGPHLSSTVIYSRSVPGGFIEDTGPHTQIHFYEVTFLFKF